MGARFFRHGELHLVVLKLLETRAMHGYDIMKELRRLYGPRYRASAGSVYPAVEALQAEGLISSRTDGERRIFELTHTGQDALRRRSDQVTELELRTGVQLGRTSVEASLERLRCRVLAVAEHLDTDAVEELLSATADQLEQLARTLRQQPTPESESHLGQRPNRHH